MRRPSRRQTLTLGVAAGLVTGLPANAAAPVSSEPTFTLLLVNDVYNMSESDGRGGLARLTAIVRAERARGTPLLYAHAGDALSPSLMSGFDRGAHIIALLNLEPPDVFVPGNHEFDFGQIIFTQRMGEASFPVFAANLRSADGEPLPGIRDRLLVTLGGIRVGIVGIALSSTPEKSQSGDFRFAPELETLIAQAARLRTEGADFIVAVAHADRATDEAIARARVADVLLSGHDHDLFLRYDGQTVVAESGFDAHQITAIDIVATAVGEGKARTISWRPSFRVLDSALAIPDPEALAFVKRLEGDLSRELDVPVGSTLAPLDSRVASVRARESSFGSLVADALRDAAHADVAITNGGGIRADRLYAAGSILTRRDILTELPFGNTAVLVTLNGVQLRAVLESGFMELGRPSGRFAHVSGLVVTLDASAPAGRRIIAVDVRGEPLDEARLYTVASNNFLYDGGNGYGGLARGRTLVGATDGKLVANEVMTYITRNTPLPAPIQGRLLVHP